MQTGVLHLEAEWKHLVRVVSADCRDLSDRANDEAKISSRGSRRTPSTTSRSLKDDSKSGDSRFIDYPAGGIVSGESRQGKASRDSFRSQAPNRSDLGKRGGKESVKESSTVALGFGVPAHVNTITAASNSFIKTVAQLRRSAAARDNLRRSVLVGLSPIR